MLTREKQDILDLLGYRCSNDDTHGPKTENALQQFRSEHHAAYGGGMSDEQALVKALKEWEPRSSFDDIMDMTYGDMPTGTFWDGIKYFKRAEFKCQCGGKYCNGFPSEPVEKLLVNADKVRAHFGRPAHVTSGVRCEVHNAEVGGVPTSRHRLGWAMDFYIDGVSGSMLDAYVGTLTDIAYHYNIPGTDCVHMDVVL